MPALAFEARLPEPSNPHEQICQACSRPATTVINGTPECDEHTGMRVLAGENPELIGRMIRQSLSRKSVFGGGPALVSGSHPHVTEEDFIAQAVERESVKGN